LKFFGAIQRRIESLRHLGKIIEVVGGQLPSFEEMESMINRIWDDRNNVMISVIKKEPTKGVIDWSKIPKELHHLKPVSTETVA